MDSTPSSGETGPTKKHTLTEETSLPLRIYKELPKLIATLPTKPAFFNATFNGPFKKANEGIVYLEEGNVAVFEDFGVWLIAETWKWTGWIYDNTPKGSGLRKLLIEMAMRVRSSIYDFDAGKDVPEFVAEYVQALGKRDDHPNCYGDFKNDDLRVADLDWKDSLNPNTRY
ncbi:hypothetical protein SLS56_004816 [Neofusicoccum ribis]|uniref:Uncharacterized protein n=1 Tax=Neofusicoccum ribis TaxID=45134 RepID=A0ABR3SVE5_9PEZI